MQLKGNVIIHAPREKVWAFLTNPHAVAGCAPGLDSLEVVVPNEKFKAVATVGFGTVKATFANDVEFVELVPPDQAKVKVHGTAPGSAVDLVAKMFLTDSLDGSDAPDAANRAPELRLQDVRSPGQLWAWFVAQLRKLRARFAPAPAPTTKEATELRWEADVVIAGSIASTATRLMGTVTKQLTRVFFNCVKDKIEA